MYILDLFLLLYSSSFVVQAVDIVDYPGDVVWIKEGDSVTLTCKSATPWQWCYWEVNLKGDGVFAPESITQTDSAEIY